MTRKAKTTGKTIDAADILNRHFGKHASRRAAIARMKQDMAIGSQIHAARTRAGMTQTQLARLVGTTQSVISDLEDAEYQGHTLTMLRRVADALGFDVQVRLTARSRSARRPMVIS